MEVTKKFSIRIGAIMSMFDKASSFYDDDYFYGEIYECSGEFWAEVIVTIDGVEQVSMKSPALASRAQARTWLTKQGVKTPVSLSEKFAAALSRRSQGNITSIATQVLDVFRRNLKAA